MAAAQPVGLGFPPAPPQAAYYEPQEQCDYPPGFQPHYSANPHPGSFGTDQERAHWSMETSGDRHRGNGNKHDLDHSTQQSVNEMLDTLPKEVWKNPNLKWLDPSAGMGNFPVAVYMRLMEGLKSVIEDDEN